MRMNRFVKLGIVIAGYILALVGASVAFYLRLLVTQDATAQAASGMYAFGDELLFWGMFGILALIPTVLGLYFLRPIEKLWAWFAGITFACTVIGVVLALVDTVINLSGLYNASSVWLILSFIGIMHALATPLLLIGFIALAVIAPVGRSRRLMLGAAGAEFFTGAYALGTLLFLHRLL